MIKSVATHEEFLLRIGMTHEQIRQYEMSEGFDDGEEEIDDESQ